MKLTFDHLVVATRRLAEGVAWVEDLLGVRVPPGGKHEFMGTHNHVLRLGEGAYLEVIAVDPDAKSPARPRWFALDEPALNVRVADRPRLIHWVVRTNDIEKACGEVSVAQYPIVAARRGALHWKITIPDDGALPMDGAFPTLIEWPEGPHVSSRMEEMGCSLERLTVSHPRASEISKLLAPHFDDARIGFVVKDSVALQAVLSTPRGIVKLD
jgi:catechol 2,3-dioxygenase-like lactoylglutathione lyase family enzyme